nr:long-chain-fatty-acid--CoA ligase [Candidatus Freyarchaeota archaeon]
MFTAKNMIEYSLDRYANNVAVKFVDKEITYKEFDLLSTKFANALLELGVEKGDRVAGLMLNKPEYITLKYAMAKAGLVEVGINPLLAKSDIEYIIKDSEAKAVIADFWFLDFIREKKPSIETLEHLIGIPIGEENLPEGVYDFNELVNGGSTEYIDVETSPDDLAGLGYTGGTTGRPKGVMITNFNSVNFCLSWTREHEIRPSEKLLLMAPLSHLAGIFFYCGGTQGATSVITPGFDAGQALELIEKERITWMLVVPTMLNRMLESPKIKEVDLSSLNTIVYAAAPMSPQRLKEAIKVFGNIFIQLYGQTEQLCITTMTKEEHKYALEKKEELLKSCGKPMLLSQIKIIDKEGKELGVNEPGVVAVKSPASMKGYWKLPEKTKETVKDGWVETGDIGYIDEDGYLYLIDRDKDMIKTGGYNVYSTKVERAIMEHPDVLVAAVIAVPDSDWGEAVKAIVQLKDGSKVTPEEIIKFAGKRLAKYEKPKSVDIVDQVPITLTGKVDKRKLREPYWKGMERQIH